MSTALSLLVLAAVTLTFVSGQSSTAGSFPHAYPGMPTGDFSPEWQSCEHHPLTCPKYSFLILVLLCTDFQVTQPLHGVNFTLGRNWAGNIPVGRAGHPNNTLFFWAFEKENGSLTAAAGERSDEPWGIWLNGGYVLFLPRHCG